MAQLGWYDHDDQAHVDLLWSLSRAPDPDAALRALVRLAENPETGWDRAQRRPARPNARCADGCSPCSARRWPWAITWSPNRESWHLLAGNVNLPTRDELRGMFTECVDEALAERPGSAMVRLRTLYRDQLLVLAALDLAATVEDEPVVPFTVVGGPPLGPGRRRAGRRAAGRRDQRVRRHARRRGWRSSRWANAVPAN